MGTRFAQSIVDRFWEKVDQNAGPSCWLWIGARSPSGYGKLMTRKGSFEMSHRLAWMMMRGEIPHGLQVLHKCDNPSCVRPDHLFLGTQADNVHDCHAKGRWRYTPRDQSGEKNPNAFLSDAQVVQMMADLAAGERPVSVARKYGINYRTLWAIRRRQTVGH